MFPALSILDADLSKPTGTCAMRTTLPSPSGQRTALVQAEHHAEDVHAPFQAPYHAGGREGSLGFRARACAAAGAARFNAGVAGASLLSLFYSMALLYTRLTSTCTAKEVTGCDTFLGLLVSLLNHHFQPIQRETEIDPEQSSSDMEKSASSLCSHQQEDEYESVIRRAQPKHTPHLGWVQLVFVMLAEVIGVGVLSLPRVFARLGWIPAFGINIAFFLLTSVTGMQIFRARNAHPEARSFPDMFEFCFGRTARFYAAACVYTVLFMYTSANLLVQADSWRNIAPSLSLPVSLFIAAACTLVVNQARSFSNIAVVSVVGSLSVMVPTVIAIIGIASAIRNDPEQYPRGSTVLFGSSATAAFVAVLEFMYSYAGHVVYFELISELRTPSDFPKALWLSQFIIFAVYIVIGAVMYHLVGDAEWLESPFTLSLPSGGISVIVQGLISVHVVTTGAVNNTVLVGAIQSRLEPIIKLLFHPRAHQVRNYSMDEHKSISSGLHLDAEAVRSEEGGGERSPERVKAFKTSTSLQSVNMGDESQGESASDPEAADGEDIKVQRWYPKIAAAEDWTAPAVLWWLLWTSLVSLTQLSMCIVIPSFDNIISLSASLIATQSNLIWPSLLDWRLFSPSRTESPLLKRFWYSGLDLVIALVGLCLLVGGTISNLSQIV
ncbi:N amino acid transport system protein [Porphyridium purpureum]|uniref:N amino acid transport system protein n=1 Tax=Porphyridium purpureum TaxID=35688 RepID=A0A5J4YYM1_PORPP|nr:N amino acid transport system protein [Porphyridium purpureum]|eukprot:POR5383..scf208_2